jgi:hypothetical protein
MAASHSEGSRSLIMDHHDIVVFSVRRRRGLPALVSMLWAFLLYIFSAVRGRSGRRILLMGCMWARLELPAAAQCAVFVDTLRASAAATGHSASQHRPPTSPLDAHGQVFASSKRASGHTRETATGLQVMTMT